MNYNDYDDIPDFPPSPYIDRMAQAKGRTSVQPASAPVPVTFDEVRMEVRIARYLSSQSVQLEVAHHFYYQGVRVVKGRWTFLVVSDQTANHLIMHGISGSVQCRE